MLRPHGGTLVNREAFKSKEEIFSISKLKISITERNLNDIEMIASGVFSPLCGFMNEKDFTSVIEKGRLANSIPWTIPVVLAITEEQRNQIDKVDQILLEFNGQIYASMDVESIYQPDKETWVKKIYQTDDKSHPGVAYVKSLPPFILGGKVQQYLPMQHKKFLDFRFTPNESRQIFSKKKWRIITAFQTRNPIHRAHEYLLKCALEMSDGLLIHPLIGETKQDDVPAEVRMQCYTALIDNYFPKYKVQLAAFPAAMNYAGPKEAIFHAICRKNYGCTHFIVGRDHAGVGNFYGTYDAHNIFNDYSEEEIGIKPLKFEHAYYCNHCKGMASDKTCSKYNEKQHHVFLSGTKVREMLSQGKKPPEEFTRPEVAKILTQAYSG